VDLGLAEHVVVVFGAARGIGAAIAKAFANEGAHVTAVDRDPSVHDLAKGIPQSLCLVADVTDLAAVRQASHAVDARFGRCDHVVFAVGVGSGKFGFPFWKLEPADWDPVLKINLIGAVNVAHVFAPAMASATRSFLGRRPNRLAVRPSLQCCQSGPDQLRSVCRERPRSFRRSGQHALSWHGPDAPQSGCL
jgi:NAD(P)-dependent dehydrogenase (short-subunit alcohol dehydrogenase family)